MIATLKLRVLAVFSGALLALPALAAPNRFEWRLGAQGVELTEPATGEALHWIELPRAARAVAVDEAGGVVWWIEDSSLKAQGFDGELLTEVEMPLAGSAVHLDALSGQGLVSVEQHGRHWLIDLAGRVREERPTARAKDAPSAHWPSRVEAAMDLPRRAIDSYREQAQQVDHRFAPILDGPPTVDDERAAASEKLSPGATKALCPPVVVPSLVPLSQGGFTMDAGFALKINTLVVHDDGSGPALYAAGQFRTTGATTTNHIAKWTGSEWLPVGSGFNNEVTALAAFDDGSGSALYAAGRFGFAGGLQVNGVARWTGRGWGRVGYGVNDVVYSLAVYDDGDGPRLYAGGAFTFANHGTPWHGTYAGISVRGFARWNGAEWQAVGDNSVTASTAYSAFLSVPPSLGSRLIFRGSSTTLDGILSWNGSQFASVLPLAAGELTGPATVHDRGAGPRLVMRVTNTLREWDGASWQNLPAPPGNVYSLLSVPTGPQAGLYAGGEFQYVNSAYQSHLLRLDGSTWTALDGPLGHKVDALTVFAGSLIGARAAASFQSAAVERFESGTWQPLGEQGFDYAPAALATFDDGGGDTLFVGGAFTRFKDTNFPGILRYDSASGYSPVEGGVNGALWSLLPFDDGSGPALYAGGSFTAAGGVAAPRIARLRAGAWEAVGAGLSKSARALTTFDTGSGAQLYAAGDDGATAGFVARWDGSDWTEVGGSVVGQVRSLTVWNGALYAAGDFTSIGGVAASRVARFDGTAWSALGAGFNSTVKALAVSNGGLYAGGAFTRTGTTTVLRVAQWNGTSWVQVGSGLGGSSLLAADSVSSLAVFDDGSGDALHAGGSFTLTGTAAVRGLAKLQGSVFKEVASGAFGSVSALLPATLGGTNVLYVSSGSILGRLESTTSCPAQAIAVSSPESGSWVRQPFQTFVGSIVKAAAFFANGRRVSVAPDLSFVYGPVTLSEGANQVLFEADTPGAGTTSLIVSVGLDTRLPNLAFTAPPEGATVYSSRPDLDLTATDLGSGVDLESLVFTLAGQALPVVCSGSSGHFRCTPSDDLPSGVLTLSATIADVTGNSSAAATLALTVSPAAATSTTVVGEVRRADGGAAVGAVVSVLGALGATATVAADGSFSIPNVPAGTAAPLTVVAELKVGDEPQAAVATAAPVPGGATSVGTLVLAPGCRPGFAAGLFSAVGVTGGATPRVLALAVYDDGQGPKLYIGGDFTNLNGVVTPFLGRWDGTSFSALPSSPNGRVRALAVHDDGNGPALYVGGEFSRVGSVVALGVARFTAAGWSDLGGGVSVPLTSSLNPIVYSLASFTDASGPGLYVGGTFTNAGELAVANIARWSGSAWSALGTGVAQTVYPVIAAVYALSVWDDGSGPALYAGGVFNRAGGLTARHVARWNGSAWSVMAQGVGTGSADGSSIGVSALVGFDDGSGAALYAAGFFANAGLGASPSVARWDGQSWKPVGAGLTTGGVALLRPQGVQALAVFDDGSGSKLYALGEIRGSGTTLLSHFAAWDGQEWRSTGGGLASGDYGGMALAVYNEGGTAKLFLGGSFAEAGGMPAGGLASFSAGRFSALGRGTSGAVYAMTVHDDGNGAALYLGGDFLSVEGVAARRVARFDGRRWSALGVGFNDTVRALQVWDDGGGAELYAGGEFGSFAGESVDGLAVWNGYTWTEVGGGLTGGAVRGLAAGAFGGSPELYATGTFTIAGTTAAARIARWNGTSWSALGTGLNSEGRALAFYNGSLYVTGNFTTAGGVSAAYVARWSGSAWSALLGGLYSPGNTLLVWNDGSAAKLFIAGTFGSVNGQTHNQITAWNGTAYSALGSGLGPEGTEVFALGVWDDGRGPALYAGGSFATAEGLPALRVARWSGTAWSALDSGVSAPVQALAVFDDGDGEALFLGGQFATAGAGSPAYLARWGSALACSALDRWDLISPLLAIDSPSEGSMTTDNRPVMSLSYADSGTGVVEQSLIVSGAGASFSCLFGPDGADCQPQTALLEGLVTLTATVSDFVGNVSPTVTRRFTVDSVPPTLVFLAPEAGAVVRTALPEIRLTLADATSGIDPLTLLMWRGATPGDDLDGTGGPLEAPCSVTGTLAICLPEVPLPEGPVTISATLRDRAGNAAIVPVLSFTVSTFVAADLTPPVLSFITPQPLAVFDANTAAIRLAWGDSGRGIDPESLSLTVNGAALAISCTTCATGATCSPRAAVSGDVLVLTATVADRAGNLSAPASVRFATRPGIDLVPPTITVASPADGSVVFNPALSVRGAVDEPSVLTVNGAAVALDAALAFDHGPVTLAEGANTLTLEATDPAGNSTTLTLLVHLDSYLPAPVNLALVTVSEPVAGVVTLGGAAGAVSPTRPDLTVRIANTRTLAQSIEPVAADGGFSASLAAVGGDRLSLVTETASGRQSEARTVTVPGAPAPPVDPSTLAPPLNPSVAFDLCRDTAFLHEHPDGGQTGANASLFDCRRVTVIRGRVLDRTGAPVAGALVSVASQPGWGNVTTRLDGGYELVGNGGGLLPLEISKASYLPMSRLVEAGWSEFAHAPDVVLTPLDSAVTPIELALVSGTAVARGSVVTDSSGTRQATLLFPAGLTATATLADGASQALSTLSVRATEYTVGERGPLAMPGELPATSGYTYAVELSVDEAFALGASRVSFSAPVVSTLENFLGFPVGTPVPVAYFDRALRRWIPSENGRVIGLLSITNGLADLDLTGSGTPADATALAAVGISDAERAALATVYAAGQSFWRVRVEHFTPFDYNFPVQPTAGAAKPKAPKPKGGDQDKRKCDETTSGSIIECNNQILGEVLGISGSGLTLHYTSDRVPGRKIASTLDIPLSGGSLPPGVKRVELEVEVAGQKTATTLAPSANQSYQFSWNGQDAFGRAMQGRQPYSAKIGYVYDATYQVPPNCDDADCFGGLPFEPAGPPARREVTMSQNHRGTLGIWDAQQAEKMGGWTLSVHHRYDVKDQTLYYGDGRRRPFKATPVMRTVVGNGAGDTPDEVPAAQAQLRTPSRVVLAPPVPSVGSPLGGEGFYVLDKGNCKVKFVTWESELRTVMGMGCGLGAVSADPYGLDLEALPPDEVRIFAPQDLEVDSQGNLYLLDRANWVFGQSNPDQIWRIYRVTPDARLEVVHFNGDDPGAIAIDQFGTLMTSRPGLGSFVARVDGIPQSTIVAGGREGGDPYWYFAGPNWLSDRMEPAHSHWFHGIRAMAFAPDSDIYISESDRVLRLTWDGWVEHVVGGAHGNDDGTPDWQDHGPFYSGDGCDANGLNAWTGCPENGARIDIRGGDFGFARDGAMLFADAGNHRIRHVDSFGTVRTLAGSGVSSEEAGSTRDGWSSTAAHLNFPSHVLELPDGNLLIADYGNHKIRSSGPGVVGSVFGPSGDLRIPSEDGSQLFVFDPEGRHLATLEAQGGTPLLTFSYNAEGFLVAVEDAFGNVTNLVRNGAGHVTRIVAPLGQETALGYDARGYLATVTNAAGERVELTSSVDGLLETLKDPKLAVTRFTYDALGRLIKDEDPLLGATTLARTELVANELLEAGYQVSLSTAMGRTTLHKIEQKTDGSEVKTIRAPDGTETVVVTNVDQSKRTTYADGSVATMVAQPEPRHGMQAPILSLGTVTTPSGLTSTTTSSRQYTPRVPAIAGIPAGDLRNFILNDSVTVDGRTATSSYDFNARTLTSTSPLGRSSSATRDVFGRMVETSQPGILPVAMSYDTLGRLSTVTQGDRSSTTTYNPQGHVASVTDPLGRVSQATYDAEGRVLTQTLPDGRMIAFAYDLNGNVTSITPPTKPAHQFGHDATDRATAYTPPPLGAGEWATTLSYNLDHQVTRVTRPDGQVIDSTYDPTSGRLTSTTTPRGVYTPSYDAASGNLTGITGPGGTGLAFTYDGSLPLSVTWTGEVAGSVSATYNNRFEVTERKINGGHAVSYSTNDDGQLTQAGPLALSYDAVTGFPAGSTAENSTDALAFSSFGELSSYTASHDSAPMYQTTFTRDRGGRITEKVEVIAGNTDTFTYAYDGAGRLVEVTKNGSVFEHYEYDGNSNRTSWTDPWGSHTATVDDQDRLLSTDSATYTYNANGELLTKTAGGNTVSYEYDVSGQLLGVDLPSGIAIDYVLDASNRRAGKKINGTLVKGWLYGGSSVAAELDGAGNVVATFVYARKGHVPELMVKGADTYRLITDHLGSVRLVVNTATGAVAQRLDYSAFGRVMLDSNPGFQPFGYAGGLFDTQTGLTRFGARDYDPEVGRWTARDPIGFSAGDSNLYGYVFQDPVNLNDPSGLIAPLVIWGAIEIGLLAWDIYDAWRTLNDPCASEAMKGLSLAGLAVGALLPGGGYGTGGKAAAKASARRAGPKVAPGKIHDINPNFPSAGRTQNCTSCAIATELTFRGRPSSALPSSSPIPADRIIGTFGGSWQKMKGRAEITRTMEAMNPGSSGIVYGLHNGGQTAHVFNVVVDSRGVMQTWDGQSGARASWRGYQDFWLVAFPK